MSDEEPSFGSFEWVVLQAYRVKGGAAVVDYLVSVNQDTEWWTDSVERAERFGTKAGALIAARKLPRTARKIVTAVTAVELLPGSVEELLRTLHRR